MRKSTSRLFLSGIAGAFLGAIIIVLVLSMIGAGRNATDEKSLPDKNNNAATPTPTPVPSIISSPTVSQSPSAENKNKINTQIYKEGNIKYSIPASYRLAGEIAAFDMKNASQGFAAITLTKGTLQQERDYLKVVDGLQGVSNESAIAEMPQFLPGQTITIGVGKKNIQESDAKLSRGQENISTNAGLSGTRYIRVEGQTPYDITYLKLPDGRMVYVLMSYGSAEPLFDEVPYLSVINSISGL